MIVRTKPVVSILTKYVDLDFGWYRNENLKLFGLDILAPWSEYGKRKDHLTVFRVSIIRFHIILDVHRAWVGGKKCPTIDVEEKTEDKPMIADMHQEYEDTKCEMELKPCPYCGVQTDGAKSHLVNCFFSYLNDGDIDKAFTVWNNRPLEDALKAKLEDTLLAIYSCDIDMSPMVAVAQVCDEILDKSGTLLGRIRNRANKETELSND